MAVEIHVPDTSDLVNSPFRTIFVWDESGLCATNGQYAGLKIQKIVTGTVNDMDRFNCMTFVAIVKTELF